MQILALAGAGIVLLIAVGVGIVAHELSHAAVLSLFGIQCDIDIGPDGVGPRQFNATISGTWASVTPRKLTPDTSAWALRLSSVAPLVLAVPFLAVLTGIAYPVQADGLLLSAWTVGWLACALPSPQDFAVFWYADRAIAEHTATSPDE